MSKYETIAGNVSEGDTFAKAIMHLREAQDCMYMIGHLRKANDDKLTGQGFIAVGEMLKKVTIEITRLAIGKMRQ